MKNLTLNSRKLKLSGRLGRRPMCHGHLGEPTHVALQLPPLRHQLLLFHKPLPPHPLLCHCFPMIPSFKLSPCLPSYPHLHFLPCNWIIHIWILWGPLCLICPWVICLCCPLCSQVLCNQVCLCHPCPWTLHCPCTPHWMVPLVPLAPHQWSLTSIVWLLPCHFHISVLDYRFGCLCAFLLLYQRLNKTPWGPKEPNKAHKQPSGPKQVVYDAFRFG